MAARRTDALAARQGPLSAATEGFSLALTVTAALLVLGAVLVAALPGRTTEGPVLPGRTDGPVLLGRTEGPVLLGRTEGPVLPGRTDAPA
ncbi:hypothetical protein [Streptomyces sp. NBC_01438]|uniref:hypothetical protein n=1 Tax=Streptomyces sp. NBC_01438 TaxID=2903866 RepID=UPI00324FF692